MCSLIRKNVSVQSIPIHWLTWGFNSLHIPYRKVRKEVTMKPDTIKMLRDLEDQIDDFSTAIEVTENGENKDLNYIVSLLEGVKVEIRSLI